MPFGPSREAPGGVSAGVLKPEGPGPFPDDLFTATDIEGLPWTRKRGDEWTTAPFRAIVLAFLRAFFVARGDTKRLIGWRVTERANGPRMGSTRLAARDHYLLFEIQQRVGEAGERSVETAINFPPDDRVTPRTESRLSFVEQTLDVLIG